MAQLELIELYEQSLADLRATLATLTPNGAHWQMTLAKIEKYAARLQELREEQADEERREHRCLDLGCARCYPTKGEQ